MPIKVFSVIFFTFGTETLTSKPLSVTLPPAMTSLSLSLSYEIDLLK
jgi:hypothetical protein